jgi:hypothetical protein
MSILSRHHAYSTSTDVGMLYRSKEGGLRFIICAFFIIGRMFLGISFHTFKSCYILRGRYNRITK